MIDFYKRLRVNHDADAPTIRAALDRADPATRDAARLILLDPRRRTIYDRNRQVLATIGLLRARLGLNYTRFWSRAAFADFAVELEPVIPPDVPRPRGRFDPMAVVRAFGPRRRRRHHHRHALWWGLLALVCVVVLVVTWVIVWRVLQT